MRKLSPPNLLARENRGLLLDVFVFFLNLVLMRWLTGSFLTLIHLSNANERLAQIALLLVCLNMWVLPAAGAVLKRWRFHERLQHEGKDVEGATVLAGCVFNPVFYFCLNIVLVCAFIAGVDSIYFGEGLRSNGFYFLPILFVAINLTIVQTVLIYRYFTPPQKPPRFGFLKSPESEILGDVFIFVNMTLFQVAWNLFTSGTMSRPADLGEVLGRLFLLCFAALLIYFPPRMLYLAEDISRGRTWVMMLIANSPVIVRLLIGHA